MTSANDNRPADYDAMLVKYSRMVRNLARKMPRRFGSVEEMEQEINVAALKRWRYYDPKYSFCAWLRLVSNYVFDKHSETAGRHMRDGFEVSLDDAPLTKLSVSPAQQDYAELSDVLRRLQGRRDGEVFLRYASGDLMREIGDEFGLTRQRITQIVENERERLQRAERWRFRRVAA
ncbi:sigma-70 family RNA polymerase sigma factor [Sinorhizobium medicae]|nr:sigma-70 family RNA polymerase sigma factor [Sinorhizobium medicae]